MKYTVELHTENDYPQEVQTVKGEAKARKLAHESARVLNGQVYVTWFRATDEQKGYLNRDGHNPVGKAW